MAEQKPMDPAEERYQYIGFERFPGKVDPFWKNDDERKSYVSGLKDQIGSIYRNSVVYSDVLTPVDRWMIMLVAVLMIVAPFLPWMRAHTLYGPESFGGITGLFGLGGFWFYVEKIDGWVIPFSVYLLAAMAALSLILGVMVLLAVFGKAPNQDVYLQKVKRALRLNGIGVGLFLVIILFSLIGQRIPFGQHLGIEEIGARYSIVSFINLSHAGLWLSVFGFVLNFNKSKDL